MSSDDSLVDKETAHTINSGRETIGAMLSTAQTHLQKVFIIFVIGFIATFYAISLWIWPQLKADLLSKGAVIVAVTPFDVILLQAKIGLIGGILLSIPPLLYFSRDTLRNRGLYPDISLSWWKIIGLAMLVSFLFVGGIMYAYTVIFPFLFEFLTNNAIRAGFQPTYSIVKWTEFIAILALVMGLAAELPLFMTILTYTEIASYELFRNKWKHAILAIVVFASLANGSPDPLSMSLVAAPMLVLYGVGLVCAKIIAQIKNRRDTTSSEDGVTSLAVEDPTKINLTNLDAAGVRSAPPEAFATLTEKQALQHARVAMDASNPTKAQAILDRYDENQQNSEQTDVANAVDSGTEVHTTSEDESENVVTRTTAGMVDAFTEDETTEEDIGGYYYDLRFIYESLTSKMFRLVGVFMLVMMATFMFLYRGGIGIIKRDFLARVPPTVEPGQMNIVLLHPIEVLVFEMKISAILGTIAVLPLLLYYAWPAIQKRGLARGDRSIFFSWAGALALGLIGGSLFGYLYIAPTIISYLVYDAISAGMIIAYRVPSFFWLISLTTVGIGLLIEIPTTMVLFYRGGIVSYRTMRDHWRVITIGLLSIGGLFPQGIFVMFLIAVPSMVAYGFGLAFIWTTTIGGRYKWSRTA